MATYQHGVYNQEQATSLTTPIRSSAALQVIFGTAPVHLADDPTKAANTPKLCYSFAECQAAVGYSDDFKNFTLCQSIDANFRVFNNAPIILVNVLDPSNSKHTKSNEEESCTVANGQAVYTKPYVLLDTLVVKKDATPLVAETDYTAAHDDDGSVVITLISETAKEAESLSVSSTSLNPAGVTKEDVVGGVDTATGKETGLELVRQIYPKLGLVPGLLLAPGAGQTLAQYGEILGGVVPEILPCIGCTQPGKWHCYDVWQHSAAAVAALDLRGQDTRGVRVLCWATFLHDIAKPLCRSVGPDGAAHFKGHNQRGAQLARGILRRLKAPAYLIDGAVGLIAVHAAPLPADDAGILKLLNRNGAIFLRRLCALKYADLDAHARTPEVAARRADVEAFEHRMDELAKTGCYTMRQLTVNGADLMDAGIPTGPDVGATLQMLLTAVMEGKLPNEREALLKAVIS